MAEAPNGAVETAKPQTDDPAETPITAPTEELAPLIAEPTAAGEPPASAPVVEPQPQLQPQAQPEVAAMGNFAPALLKNRFIIKPDEPLAEMDSPSARAYMAEDQREPARALFALVCTPGLPSRNRIMGELKSITISGLMALVDFGPVKWEPLAQKCMVVILERPLGGRLIDAFQGAVPKVNEYELGKRVLEPISHALAELAEMDIPHRAIRLDNLYFLDKEHTELVLGECVSAPPAYDQPSYYEPMDRGLADPAGRGHGSTLDDSYALGVLCIELLLGHKPGSGKSDNEISMAKLEGGSYQALSGKERIPLSMIEPLRGLLSDDPAERWGSVAVDIWLGGQKKTPIQRKPAAKPTVPYTFAGYAHRTPRTIAMAMAKNVSEAAVVIKNKKLELWLRQGMKNPYMADTIQDIATAANISQGTPDGSDDVIVARAIIRLDPEGPIRYKQMAFVPDGFPSIIAVEYSRKNNFQTPSEIMARDLIGYWFSSQPEYSPDSSTLEKSFSTLRSFFMIKEMGYGIERCLYELNRTMPCQSSLIQSEYIDSVEGILEGLDEISSHIDLKTRPMDKHIAAYVATHFKFDTAPHLKALSDPIPEASLIGMLSLFALMQWRLKMESLYGLSRWLGSLLTPAISVYHSRSTRHEIEEAIPMLVRQGSLPGLFDLIDNAQRKVNDNDDFKDAQAEFAVAEAEIQKISGSGEEREKIALQSGERATAVASILIGMTGSVLLLIFSTW